MISSETITTTERVETSTTAGVSTISQTSTKKLNALPPGNFLYFVNNAELFFKSNILRHICGFIFKN